MNEEFSLATRETAALETVDGAEMIVDLTSAVTSYCSLVPKTDDDHFRAVNGFECGGFSRRKAEFFVHGFFSFSV